MIGDDVVCLWSEQLVELDHINRITGLMKLINVFTVIGPSIRT